jgi:calcium channel MID1
VIGSLERFDLTLIDNNCAIIYNLSFCDQTAYAVPSNPNNFPNMTSLAAFYDNYTSSMYKYFEKVIALTPCETTSSAQYSLARTCEDCAKAYKSWLCAVTIPRCTDFTSTNPWLQERAMGQPFPNGTFLSPSQVALANTTGNMAINGSRNPSIDSVVVPGPYKEVLPCDKFCYELVQSCPASMGFGCPLPGQQGFNESYSIMPEGGGDEFGVITTITCNSPGQAYYLAAGSRAVPSLVLVLISAVLAVLLI